MWSYLPHGLAIVSPVVAIGFFGLGAGFRMSPVVANGVLAFGVQRGHPVACPASLPAAAVPTLLLLLPPSPPLLLLLRTQPQGTRAERVINELFEGHTSNYLECVNVDYKSSRRESFMDLQLDVKGCANIYDSFDK